MSYIFETTDPRGFKVFCTEDCWNSHILVARPFMKGWEQVVREAIEQPSIGIFRDVQHPDRHIFYRIQQGNTRYIKAVVKFNDNSGTVITAFPTDSCKSGEKLIWTQSDL